MTQTTAPFTFSPMPNTPGAVVAHLMTEHDYPPEQVAEHPDVLRLAHLNAHGLNDRPELADPGRAHDHTAPTFKALPGTKAMVKSAVLVLGCATAAAFFISATTNDDNDSTTTGSASPAMAFQMCKDFVKDQLRAPATATFRNFYEKDGEVSVTGYGAGPYTVRSTVDSENGFGAKLRSSFTCTVTNTAGDSWQLNDITLR